MLSTLWTSQMQHPKSTGWQNCSHHLEVTAYPPAFMVDFCQLPVGCPASSSPKPTFESLQHPLPNWLEILRLLHCCNCQSMPSLQNPLPDWLENLGLLQCQNCQSMLSPQASSTFCPSGMTACACCMVYMSVYAQLSASRTFCPTGLKSSACCDLKIPSLCKV